MIKEVMTGAYVRNGEIIEFNFSNNLSVSEKMDFVDTVTNILIGENYNFVLRDLVFNYRLISMLTDIDLSEMKNTEDSIGFIEDFLEETNIVDVLKANVKEGLIEELNEVLDINLEYRTGVKINALNKALTSLLITIEKKINGIDTEEMMQTAMALSNITGEIDKDKIIEAYIGHMLKDE